MIHVLLATFFSTLFAGGIVFVIATFASARAVMARVGVPDIVISETQLETVWSRPVAAASLRLRPPPLPLAA